MGDGNTTIPEFKAYGWQGPATGPAAKSKAGRQEEASAARAGCRELQKIPSTQFLYSSASWWGRTRPWPDPSAIVFTFTIPSPSFALQRAFSGISVSPRY